MYYCFIRCLLLISTADEDFNTTDAVQNIPGRVQPEINDDSNVELTEGFIALLQIETTDQRDLQRIRYLNDIVLVTIEDDGRFLLNHVFL